MADNFSKRLDEFKSQILAMIESSLTPSAEVGDINHEGGTASLGSSPCHKYIIRQQDLDFDMMTECRDNFPSRNVDALISAFGRAKTSSRDGGTQRTPETLAKKNIPEH